MAIAAPASSAHAVAPATGWDTELFVLRGDDRAELREHTLTLAASIERDAPFSFVERAAALATELAPGGVRLVVVAASPADLHTKLRRAADRLADPKCHQIRDAAGVFFASQPLHKQGTLAVLFPGEGAQYPGMLADLCGVLPEVEATFAWCDQLAAESDRPSLRSILHPPPDRVAEAEAELRKLGPSIFGVLLADLAIIRLLWNLRLPISAVAGHSAGEIAALLVSGAMDTAAVLGPRLVEIMDIMQRQEDEAGGPDIALLAVGAGKAAVEEAARTIAGSNVMVAMDNCPHQCVAVGPTQHIAAVEKALLERGRVCERLPFRRPYHTPLFEQWMGPFRELFAGVPFAPPHTPVYCCSSAQKFPENPEGIRRLMVNHWVNPVEFTRMIETMYADGVRVFVEAGPRGNLSAFVEDILRGKPVAALPANLPRKSGPTQINHLVAQLVAHHVPLNLDHLYAGRIAPAHAPQLPTMPVRKEPSHPARQDNSFILDQYLGLMEQFLDVQREVMEAFLSNPAAHVAIPNALFDFPEFAAPPPQAVAPAFALIETVMRHTPGESIVFRRVLDERQDLYADDHTLGGRGVSKVNPNQNGLPVLPMTFSLEAMSEAASILAPGKVVVAIRNIRLYRWLPFDPEPTTLEVRASVATIDPQTGAVEVKADVRDLSNSFLRDGANKPACEAVVVLADRYPEPPEPLPFHLTEEQPCRSTVDDLRRNMFHGPLFQMIRSLVRHGKEGIEGTLEVQPRDRWFHTNAEPHVVIDPVLVDAAMHILGAWHLEQPDWSGRILLPIGVQSLEFFGPIPPIGSHVLVRGHNEEETARQARHGVELFAPDGRLWFRMTGAAYWRFYLPFGHVNFFGPKDEYFLSRDWPEAVLAREANAPPRRCHYLEPPVDLKQPVLRAAGARVTMTPRELAEFGTWTGTDDSLSDWFFSRLLAKDAVRAAWYEKHGEAMFPADMETETVDGRIVCRPRGEAKAEPFPPVAVAVAGGVVVAFSAFTEKVGIALVTVGKGEAEDDVRMRAARMAVADALRIPDAAFPVRPGKQLGLFRVAHGGQQFRVQTARQKNVVVATTLCEAEPT